MREILFRGKRVDNGEWVEGYYSPCVIPIAGTIGHFINEGGYRAVEIDPETVGQYTGLTDKNGTKIFEGDIARQDYSTSINAIFDPVTLGFVDATDIEGHHIGVVKITAQGVGMKNPTSYDDIDGTHHDTNRFVGIAGYRCKVIGNIFDNSELLKREKPKNEKDGDEK